MKLSDLLVPSTKYSKFRCDTYKKFSANPGILYPVWMQLLNPGESASVDLRSVIRTWPVESPLMGSMKVRFVTAAFNLKNYAMALEGYHRDFDWQSTVLPHLNFYYTTQTSANINYLESSNFTFNGITQSTRINKPYLLGVREGSLADYLGYENGWFPSVTTYGGEGTGTSSSVKKSFIPFLCYYDFYRNYLVNPQEGMFPMFDTRYALKTGYHPNQATASDPTLSYYLDTKSVVIMRPINLLDDLIRETHKYYDGYGSGSYMANGSTIKTVFDNLFKWDTNINSYTVPTQETYSSLRANTFSSTHGGLVSTMFDSDINTQWMSESNYNRLLNAKVKSYTDSVSGDNFTSFGDIVKASSVWDFLTKSVNSDGTYGDFIGNQFGVTVKGDMNIPQIVHVYDTLLTFDDITSQSGTSDAVLGQQAGVGRSYGQSNRFKVYNKDGNYIFLMTFMWVTPQICYSGGLGHLHDIVSFADLYQPSFDNYAMEPRLQERVHSTLPGTYNPTSISTVVSNNITQWYESPLISNNAVAHDAIIGYQPAWSDYKTDVDVVHGMFRSKLDYYTILRDVPFITNNSTLGLNDTLSTYVYSANSYENWVNAQDAKHYRLPFAIDEEDCLQVQLRVDATITRAMSKNINPNVK